MCNASEGPCASVQNEVVRPPETKKKFHERKTVFHAKEWVNTGSQAVRVYKPTMDEMRDFEGFVRKIELDGAHLASGVCKVIPPQQWLDEMKPKMKYQNVGKMRLKRALRVNIYKCKDQQGVYRQENNEVLFDQEPMTVRKFANLSKVKASIKKYKDDLAFKEMNIEKTEQKGLYAADVDGTLFGEDVHVWNMNKLDTVMDKFTKDIDISGVTTPYLYFGGNDTTFSWHAEDVDLYSINYQHFGEPKFWYAIPSSHADRFERLCYQMYQAELGGTCKTFLRHKICIMNPTILQQHGIPFGSIPQYAGEFIITFPKGYHMGFNTGFNCNEAINFASTRWLGFGLTAKMCDCNPDFAVRLQIPEVYSKLTANVMPPICPKVPLTVNDPPRPHDWNWTEFSEKMQDRLRYAFGQLETVDIFQAGFEDEVKWNRRCSSLHPYCAICHYFIPPVRSKQRVASSSLVCSPAELSTINVQNFEPKVDELRTCKKCEVTVHKMCSSDYAGSLANADEWFCDACAYAASCGKDANVRPYICCEWCFQRGGSLIEMEYVEGNHATIRKAPGRFVHTVCALINRLASVSRQPDGVLRAVSITGPRERADEFWSSLGISGAVENCGNLKAYMSHNPQLHFGTANENHCTLCDEALTDGCIAKCHLCCGTEERSGVYHPTCAKLVGFQLVNQKFPSVVAAVCPDHVFINRPERYQPLSQLSVEDKVYYTSSEGNAEIAVVTAHTPTKPLLVEGEQGPKWISTDKIIQCQCHEVNCCTHHRIGYLAHVKTHPKPSWAYIRAVVHKFNYNLQTESGSVIQHVDRTQIYTVREFEERRRLNDAERQSSSDKDEPCEEEDLGIGTTEQEADTDDDYEASNEKRPYVRKRKVKKDRGVRKNPKMDRKQKEIARLQKQLVNCVAKLKTLTKSSADSDTKATVAEQLMALLAQDNVSSNTTLKDKYRKDESYDEDHTEVASAASSVCKQQSCTGAEGCTTPPNEVPRSASDSVDLTCLVDTAEHPTNGVAMADDFLGECVSDYVFPREDNPPSLMQTNSGLHPANNASMLKVNEHKPALDQQRLEELKKLSAQERFLLLRRTKKPDVSKPDAAKQTTANRNLPTNATVATDVGALLDMQDKLLASCPTKYRIPKKKKDKPANVPRPRTPDGPCLAQTTQEDDVHFSMHRNKVDNKLASNRSNNENTTSHMENNYAQKVNANRMELRTAGEKCRRPRSPENDREKRSRQLEVTNSAHITSVSASATLTRRETRRPLHNGVRPVSPPEVKQEFVVEVPRTREKCANDVDRPNSSSSGRSSGSAHVINCSTTTRRHSGHVEHPSVDNRRCKSGTTYEDRPHSVGKRKQTKSSTSSSTNNSKRRQSSESKSSLSASRHLSSQCLRPVYREESRTRHNIERRDSTKRSRPTNNKSEVEAREARNKSAERSVRDSRDEHEEKTTSREIRATEDRRAQRRSPPRRSRRSSRRSAKDRRSRSPRRNVRERSRSPRNDVRARREQPKRKSSFVSEDRVERKRPHSQRETSPKAIDSTELPKAVTDIVDVAPAKVYIGQLPILSLKEFKALKAKEREEKAEKMLSNPNGLIEDPEDAQETCGHLLESLVQENSSEKEDSTIVPTCSESINGLNTSLNVFADYSDE